VLDRFIRDRFMNRPIMDETSTMPSMLIQILTQFEN